MFDQSFEAESINCSYTCSDNTSWTMFCNEFDTEARCCQDVRDNGCPAGASFSSGSCGSTTC